MVEQVLVKCLFIFSIIKLYQVNCRFDGFLAEIENKNKGLKLPTRLTIPKWDTNIIKDTADGMLGKSDAESGFDLNDEEIKKFKLWPKGIIPYYIDVRSYNDKFLRDKIRGFLSSVNSMTSLNFMELPRPPKDDTTRWVFFINRRGLLGCADHSIKDFTNEGVQQVVLGYDCMNTGRELPEAVLAIAGVPPQHNAPNRDDYIQVIAANIMPDKKYLFDKLNNDEWLFHDIPYDFFSAGHYHYHKYSTNGRATIDTQESYVEIPIGQTFGFSNTDIRKIRMLYNYISKKPEDQVPECNKLFVPATQFFNYRPNKKKIQPLQKPNKYLGLPDKEIHNDDIDNKDKGDFTEPDKNVVINGESHKDDVAENSNDSAKSPKAYPSTQLMMFKSVGRK